jgi:hypothetical protein
MANTHQNFFLASGNDSAATPTLLARSWLRPDVETDSHEGTQCIITPATATAHTVTRKMGGAAGSNYQGYPLKLGQVNLAQYYFAGGIIDPSSTWLYSTGSQSVAIIFKGI